MWIQKAEYRYKGLIMGVRRGRVLWISLFVTPDQSSEGGEDWVYLLILVIER